MIDSAVLTSTDTLVARFAPTGWLANAHFQSIVPSLSLRRPFVAGRARQMLGVAGTQIVECGGGVRLPTVTMPEREHTPPEFGRWLLEVARRCRG